MPLVEYPTPSPGSADDAVARGRDGVLRYRGLTPSLTEFLDVRAHRYANREAVVEIGGPRLTYRELWDSATKVAGGLQGHGISIGDRVAIRFPNGVRWVQAFLGTLLSGAVPVPINHSCSDGDVAALLDDSQADYILDDDLPAGLPFIDDGASLDELTLLVYTRGIVGRPKGVELSNENLLSAIESVGRVLNLGCNGVRNLVLLPLAYATGCVDQLLPTLAVGGTVVLAPGLATEKVGGVVSDERIDMLTATSTDYRSAVETGIARQEPAPLHRICCANGTLGPEEELALRAAFPLARQWSWWGATETSGIALALPDESARTHRGSAGTAFGGTELALWGPDAEQGTGELLCRGPNVMRGYWKNPQETARNFTGNWFHTGDLAAIDGDGFVRLLGQTEPSVEQPGPQPRQGV